MFEAMSADDFLNEAVPWLAVGFVLAWLLIMFIRMLISAWRDEDGD